MANVATLTAKMVMDLSGFSSGANKAIGHLNQLKSSVGSTAASMAAGAAGGLAMAAALKVVEMASNGVRAALRGIASEVKHGFGLAMAAESAETKFRVLLGSAEKAKKLMKDINDFTLSTPFSMAGTLDSTKKLMGAGVSEQMLMPNLRMLGDISGGNTDTLGLLSHTYGEVMSKGRVLASEMNQVAAAGVNMRGALAKEAGVGVTELSKAMENGKVTAEHFHNALHELATGKYKGMLEESNKSMEGVLNRLNEIRDTFSRDVAGGIGGKMGLKDIGNEFADVMEGLAKVSVPMVVGAFDALATSVFDFVDNLRAIGKFMPSASAATSGPSGWLAELAARAVMDPASLDLASINTRRDFQNARSVMQTIGANANANKPALPESQRMSTLTWGKIGDGLSKLFGSIPSGGDALADWRMSLRGIAGGVGSSFGRVSDRFAVGGKAQEQRPQGALVAGSSEAFSAIIRAMFNKSNDKAELAELRTISKGLDAAKKAIVDAIEKQISGVLSAVPG